MANGALQALPHTPPVLEVHAHHRDQPAREHGRDVALPGVRTIESDRASGRSSSVIGCSPTRFDGGPGAHFSQNGPLHIVEDGDSVPPPNKMKGETLDGIVYEICKGKRIGDVQEIYNRLPDVPHDDVNVSIMSLVAQNLISADIRTAQALDGDIVVISNIKGQELGP